MPLLHRICVHREIVWNSFLNLFFQEIASKELNSLQEQKNNIENEIRELEEKAVALQELYNEQEQLLSQIFGGKYVLTEKI